MQPLAGIARELSALSGLCCAPAPERALSGGSIHRAYRWPAGRESLFVKVASAADHEMLAAEADGLAELAAARALRVPKVLALGQAEAGSFLALEWLEPARADAHSERRLGEGLAALHRVTAPRYGWRRDNYIGRTPQRNEPLQEDWLAFLREQRLRPQLVLAAAWGFDTLAHSGTRLLERLPQLLAGHEPPAALLHGDLWGGNWLTTRSGEPVIFDPAVYFGDRETDLAMTRLFGGFGRAFYEAYEGSYPLPAGAPLRGELYNLYHVLNHLNLFGAGYAAQTHALLERLQGAAAS
jgi:protein-ribulosamine 3-kinase